MKPKFSHRSHEEELMDDLSCAGEVIPQTLKELETINRWLGGNKVTLNGLDRLLAVSSLHGNTLHIADWGCGGGDMLVLMAKWARKNNIKARLTGVDANPHIIDYAKKNTQSYPEISYKTQDIFSEDFKKQAYDIVTATLFTHHFDDAGLETLIKQMQSQSRLGIVINDLHRHWFAYYAIKVLTQLFSKSEMVKNDATLSVLRSFRRAEWQDIMNSSKVDHFSLRWMWAFRWQLVISTH